MEHHDLVHEFPELRERIHQLKMEDRHFQKLFDEYHELTKAVENMAAEVTPVATHTEEEYKRKRLQLKDQLYAMLVA
ncbi:YdcH family protein [Balneatrix alpica]|uniref:YdcH family protein n=1 Tax=Balneatrix alpica TaxID=75684 RepID=A0ABV5Z7H3_9GAMM|nr:DUF465 domain-containing protein [Balneatrix alpica]